MRSGQRQRPIQLVIDGAWIEMPSASTITGTMRPKSLCSPKAVREV